MRKILVISMIVVVVAVVAIILIFARRDTGVPQEQNVVVPTGEGLPESALSPQQLKEAFENPVELEHTNLSDVTDGESTGLATRVFEGNAFTHTVSASLPILIVGEAYEGWLVRGTQSESDFDVVSTGVMENVGIGKWFLSFSSNEDYSDYSNVVVTVEAVVDETPEKHILEGSF